MMQIINSTKYWLKNSDKPLPIWLYRTVKSTLSVELPLPRILATALYTLFTLTHGMINTLFRIILWTPLFKGRLARCGIHLHLYGGLPYICGPLQIQLGDHCRISGRTTITGRTNVTTEGQLQIGNNVDIGWMTTIAVGKTISIGDNVRIAGQCFLAGYPGHPMNAKDRAKGLPETDNQVGDIILEDDVWLATGVTVVGGVSIGKGSVVAAGSVVTRNIPQNVLAGGVPAKVIRSLNENMDLFSYEK